MVDEDAEEEEEYDENSEYHRELVQVEEPIVDGWASEEEEEEEEVEELEGDEKILAVGNYLT